MNKQKTLACTLSMFTAALLLLVPFAIFLAPPHVSLENDTGAGTSHYSNENLFKSGTVFNDHVISYPLPFGEVRDMAVGDLNNDGITDVVVASDAQILIIYGTVNGALGDSFTIPLVMSDIRRIAVGDLDNDGKDDIAATYYDAANNIHRVGIFYQKDRFTGSINQNPDTWYDPWQVLIGDFANQGFNSLAVICRGDQHLAEPSGLMVLKSPYTGSKNQNFVKIDGLTNLKLMAAGHINGDGRIDIVVGDSYGSTIVLLTQPSTFPNPWSNAALDIGGSIADIKFMDYSGSGTRKDLVLVKDGAYSNQIEVRENSGSIPLAPSRTFTFNGASSMAVGSAAGGSASDLLVLSASENRARLYLHKGSGLDPGTYYQFPVNSGPLKGSVVSTGIYLLSSGSPGTKPTIEIYRTLDGRISNADGNLFTKDDRPTLTCAGDVSFGIIATAYEGRNIVNISALSGDYRLVETPEPPSGLFIGDLDGDGIGDLAIAFPNSNIVHIYKGSKDLLSNGAPTILSLGPSVSRPLSLSGGRIGSIGKDVLVVGFRGGIDIVYSSMSGAPIHEVIGTGYAGDRTDIAFGAIGPNGAGSGIAALNGNKVELYFLKGMPSIGDCYDAAYSASLSMSGPAPTSIAIGDFDGDGRGDVAATTTTNQMKIFSNTGSGFAPSTLPTASVTLPGVAAQVRSGDLNDDGKDDLAVRYSSIAEIGIWLSRGSMTFSNPFDMTAGGIASGIAIADLDRDGRVDIVASSPTAKALSYWLQNNLAPDANLWYSPAILEVGETVSFDASNSTDSASDRSSLIYRWDFGDGNTSDQKIVQHQYAEKGAYSCSLTVTDRSGLADRIDFLVTVNKPMEARIWASKYSPLKGETIYLQDVSEVPNGVSSRTWDLGDGRGSTDPDVSVSYSLPGYYNITLTVTDTTGRASNATLMISVVQGTNPIEGLVANGGGTSFFMDQEILFELRTTSGGAPMVGFVWDMDYDAVAGFKANTGITINQTTWSYRTPGEHTVCVRNYNLNPFVEEYLTVYIMNVRPVADIKVNIESYGNFTFDARGSWDTATDNSSLRYRWNFGDIHGWTPYSNETRVVQNYTADGTYIVILEVMDQHGLVGSATYRAVVDSSPPAILLDSGMLASQVYRGDDLVIKVNVTDPSGVDRVLLVYTSNNETKTLIMSRVSGTDTYVATIPAADVTAGLTYYIEAVDSDGHGIKSAIMGISLTDRPDSLLIYLLLCAGAVLGALSLMYHRARMVVDDVFIIYNDGNLMAHQTRRLKPGVDDQILGSMLVAIQNFVKDSFKDEASTGLNRMDFGEKKVLVEKGDHIYLAVVLHGKREGRVPQRMRETISKAENDYYDALAGWDGDLEKVRGIKDETDPLLRTGLKDIMPSIPFISKESTAPVEMTACPYCETSYPAGEPKCPKCGTYAAAKARSEETVDGTGGPAA